MGVDGASVPPEPRNPVPEDYGISAARVVILTRLRNVIVWFLLLAFPASFLFLCTIVPFYAAVMLFVFLGSAIFLPLARLADAVVPGLAGLKSYKAALAGYKKLAAQHQSAVRNAQLKRLRAQESWWRSLSGSAFEIEVKRVLEQAGYTVQHTGSAGDGGVDLVLSSGARRILVQCKQHSQPVNPAAVRDLFGTLHARGAASAWLVSASGFTTGAREFSRGKPIELIDLRALLDARFPRR